MIHGPTGKVRSTASAALLGGAALVSCGGEGSVVFGITSEIDPSSIERIDARIAVDGEPLRTETFRAGELAFPVELSVDALADGAAVDLSLEVFSAGQPLLTRRASTQVVEGRSVLYVANLESACAAPAGPTCEAPQTCIAGVCADPFRDPAALSDYYPGWAGAKGTDRCEPGGAPEVIVGEGQAGYLPLEDGAVAQVEAGPQGGYHVWLALRMKNLKQSGTVIEVLGRVPSLDYDVPPFSVVFTFEPDEGDYCKIQGLRFRLDDEAHPIESLLGESLDITVQLTDADGDVGTGKKTVRLSDSYR